MNLHFLTLVLDGEPWIRHHLPVFDQLSERGISWHWHIAHGAAMNKGSTKWCRPQAPRLSQDGTTEYLRSIKDHTNVSIYEAARWESKDAMVNEPLDRITKECVLMQIDSDELWRSHTLAEVCELFALYPQVQRAYFPCRYFVGPDIITKGENCYGNQRDEWLRAWRFNPGDRFQSHEPPVLAHNEGPLFSKQFMELRDISFYHMAYATEKQVAFKEQFYGYRGAVNQWKRLQAHPGPWPVKLKAFLPWVDDRVEAVRV